MGTWGIRPARLCFFMVCLVIMVLVCLGSESDGQESELQFELITNLSTHYKGEEQILEINLNNIANETRTYNLSISEGTIIYDFILSHENVTLESNGSVTISVEVKHTKRYFYPGDEYFYFYLLATPVNQSIQSMSFYLGTVDLEFSPGPTFPEDNRREGWEQKISLNIRRPEIPFPGKLTILAESPSLSEPLARDLEWDSRYWLDWIEVDLEAGMHNLTFTLFLPSEVVDLDPDNRTRSLNFTIKPQMDFRIVDVEIENDLNMIFTISTIPEHLEEFANPKDYAISTGVPRMLAYVNGKFMAGYSIHGPKEQIRVNNWILDEGRNEVLLIWDKSNKIEELNESNNEWNHTFDIDPDDPPWRPAEDRSYIESLEDEDGQSALVCIGFVLLMLVLLLDKIWKIKSKKIAKEHQKYLQPPLQHKSTEEPYHNPLSSEELTEPEESD